MSKESMKLALEALEGAEALLLSMGLTHLIVYGDAEKAITTLREALANEALDRMAENARELGLDYEPAQQEPVAPKCGAIIEVFGHDWRLDYMSLPVGKHKLYTQQYTYTTPQPAQRTWVGLTDEEILEVWCIHLDEGDEDEIEEWRHVINEAREIEAKLKEKNT